MTLPNVILFPQAMLPLYVFEPRYRKMLEAALDSTRMLSIAMQKPGRQREAPSPVAGVGLIRVSVANKDGSSYLILQGLARVELEKTVQHKPFRVERVRPLTTTGQDSVAVDALAAKVLELVEERLQQDENFPTHVLNQFGQLIGAADNGLEGGSVRDLLKYLVTIENPDQLADLVSCTLLPRPEDRQKILEAVNLEDRLKHLIHFLIGEKSQQEEA